MWRSTAANTCQMKLPIVLSLAHIVEICQPRQYVEVEEIGMTKENSGSGFHVLNRFSAAAINICDDIRNLQQIHNNNLLQHTSEETSKLLLDLKMNI